MRQPVLAVTTSLVAAFSFSGCGSPRTPSAAKPALIVGEPHEMPAGDPVDVAAELVPSSLEPSYENALVTSGIWCPYTQAKGPEDTLRIRFLEPVVLDELQLSSGRDEGAKQATVVLDDGRQLSVTFDPERQRNVVVAAKVGGLEIRVPHTGDGKRACLRIAMSGRTVAMPVRVRLVPGVPPAQLAQLPVVLEQMKSAIARCDASLATLATAHFTLSSLNRPGEVILDHDALLAECRAGSLPPFPVAPRELFAEGTFIVGTGDIDYMVAFRNGTWRLLEARDRRPAGR